MSMNKQGQYQKKPLTFQEKICILPNFNVKKSIYIILMILIKSV